MFFSGIANTANTANTATTTSHGPFANPSADDYNKDIRLDPSITLGDSVSSISWMNVTPTNNFPLMFAATCWDKSVRIF